MIKATMIGLDAVKRHFDRVAKQTRYATAVALTRTAQTIVRLEEREVAETFDNPTPFTRRAFGYKRATASNLQAVVFIKDKQENYLLPHIRGGKRNAKRSELQFSVDTNAPGVYWVPGPGVKLNAAGNISKAEVIKIARALKQSGKHGKVFSGVPRPGMPFGIYGKQFKNGRSTIVPLLIQVRQSPRYQKIFDFFGVAREAAGPEFEKQFAAAFAEAMRTAR